MTLKLRAVAAAAALVTVLITATGCGVGGNSSSTGGVATTAPADGSGAAPADNPAASDDDAASTAATSIAPECQAYMTTLLACSDRLSALDPAATAGVTTAATATAQAREELDRIRTIVSEEPDPSMQVLMCRSASGAWNSRKANLGC